MFVTNKQNKRIDKKDHNLYTYRTPTYRKEYEIDKYIRLYKSKNNTLCTRDPYLLIQIKWKQALLTL